jgi:hypothetical protein
MDPLTLIVIESLSVTATTVATVFYLQSRALRRQNTLLKSQLVRLLTECDVTCPMLIETAPLVARELLQQQQQLRHAPA